MEKNNAITIDRISRSYGSNIVVNDLSFNVKEGSIHGFLGPNGAGKTTTMKMIAGVMPSHSGEIILSSDKVGALLENPPLFMDMSVESYLKFICSIHAVSKTSIKKYIEDALFELNLESVKKRLIGNLSKGYKQRVGVAGAIVFKPDIIILDEPTSGLDPKSVIEMRELIKSISEKYTVLISSHLLHEIEILCDEVTIINKGKLVASGKVSDIKRLTDSRVNLKLELSEESPGLEEALSKKKEVIDIFGFTGKNSIIYEILVESENDLRSEIYSIVKEYNGKLLSFSGEQVRLEDSFLKLLKESE